MLNYPANFVHSYTREGEIQNFVISNIFIPYFRAIHLCSPFGKNEDHIPSSTQIFEGCFYFKESKFMHLCPVVSNKRLLFSGFFFFFFNAIAYFDGKFRKDFCRQRMT